MATGLGAFAEALKASEECLNGEFRAEPYYEPKTDALIYYARDVSSYGRRITKHLTVFLSNDDDTLVGVELKGFYNTLIPALEGLGEVAVADPIVLKGPDGDDVELEIVARFALGGRYIEPLNGSQYEQLNKATSGVRFNRRQLCNR